MNKFLKFGMVVAMVALVVAAMPGVPAVVAQDGGGVIVEGTFGSGPNQFNPLFCNDTACRKIVGLTNVGMAGVDPETGLTTPMQTGALAKDWKLSDDLKTVTITLRDDYKWSDGTPVTSKDVLYAWSVYSNENSGSPFTFITGSIESVEAPDDYTVVVTLVTPSCLGINDATFYIAPAHVFGDTPIENLKDLPYNTAPTVFGGPFSFSEYRAGEQTTLVRNEAYPDGKVVPDGFIYKVVPDQTVLVERFLAGDFNYLDGAPVNRRADVKDMGDRGEATVFDFPGNSWDYFAMNFADPTNPQNGLDEAGNPIDQGKHPVLGDPAVRKAISLSLDIDAMIQGAVFGEGSRMSSFLIPTSWAANPDLEPIALDQEAAKKLLDEAGWVPGADGIRVKDGVRASFTVLTNQGNTRREAIVSLARDQLAQVGIEAIPEIIDFNLLLERMDAQTFDAIVLGWRNGFPDDPDATQLFTATSDVVNSGNNFTSWNNPEFDKLNAEAKSVAGCAAEDRAAIYQKMEEIFLQDLPYVPLFVINGQYAAAKTVEGFDPRPNNPMWNVDMWKVVAQ